MILPTKISTVGVSALQTSLCAPLLPVGACELKFALYWEVLTLTQTQINYLRFVEA